MAAVDHALEAARDRERKARNPYAIAQTLPEEALPRKRRAKPRRPRGSRSPSSQTQTPTLTPTYTASPPSPKATRRFVSSREARASELHQDFLFAALHDAQRQLEDVESLASIMCLETTAPGIEAADGDVSALQPCDEAVATVDELAALLSENATLDAAALPIASSVVDASERLIDDREGEQAMDDSGANGVSQDQDHEDVAAASADDVDALET
ncbi:hypothetical protein ATCC90586_011257 [Pythium insidiosum]|nr:hypothetical protein ATCC90586_011257 [Pythium insidiosum]